MDIELLIQLAEEGHQEVRELFVKIGKNIGIGINNLVRILNPELVIIGGLMAMAATWLIEPIIEVVKQQASLYYENNLQICFSQLGDDATVLGAASLAISLLYKKTRVRVN